MPMQYTEMLKEGKKWKISVENVCFFLFMLKTYIVGTRYNRLTEAVQTSTHNLMFWSKI